jgi:hypothetical protein
MSPQKRARVDAVENEKQVACTLRRALNSALLRVKHAKNAGDVAAARTVGVEALGALGRLEEESAQSVTFGERSAAARPTDKVRICLDAAVERERVALACLEANAAVFDAQLVIIFQTRAEFMEQLQAEIRYDDDPTLSQTANRMARVAALTRVRDQHLVWAEAEESLRKQKAASCKSIDRHYAFAFQDSDQAIVDVLSDGRFGLPACDSADRAGKKWYMRRSFWEPADGALNFVGGPAWRYDAQKKHDDGHAVEQHEERLERRNNHVRSERTQTTSVCDVVVPVLFDPGVPVTLDSLREMQALCCVLHGVLEKREACVLCASMIDSDVHKNMESVNRNLNLVEGILRMKCNMSLGNLTDRGIPQEDKSLCWFWGFFPVFWGVVWPAVGR